MLIVIQVFLIGISIQMQEFFPRTTFANLSMHMRTGKLGRTCLSLLSPFDRFVKGEGAVVVVLKPVDKAIANNDHIYTVAS